VLRLQFLPRRFGISIALLTVIALVLGAQCTAKRKSNVAVMIDLLPNSVSGWTRLEQVDTYDPQTIFDYIDGAGEVYLMFGFRAVVVAQYAKAGELGITIEVFDMGSAEDAYGVFSHARQSEDSGIGQAYEHRGNLLCFWQAQYFVCVLADGGTQETSETCLALAQAIDGKILSSDGRPELVEYLPEAGLDPYSIRYFHLHSTLNYHHFLTTENILNLSRETNAVLAMYGGSTNLLIIEYESAKRLEQGYVGFVKHCVPEAKVKEVAQLASGKWVAVKRDRVYLIAVLDAVSRDYALELINATSQQLSNVSE